MKHKTLVYIGSFVSAWLELAQAIVTILTLCIYRPWWDFQFICWYQQIVMKHLKKDTKDAKKITKG